MFIRFSPTCLFCLHLSRSTGNILLSIPLVKQVSIFCSFFIVESCNISLEHLLIFASLFQIELNNVIDWYSYIFHVCMYLHFIFSIFICSFLRYTFINYYLFNNFRSISNERDEKEYRTKIVFRRKQNVCVCVFIRKEYILLVAASLWCARSRIKDSSRLRCLQGLGYSRTDVQH